jgi:GDP-mannose 6-dehydrogenase
MNISVFGLGYVGAVTCGCLAHEGHSVIGVDVAKSKLDLINGGKSPVVEPEIEDLIAQGVRSGRLRAISDARTAILQTDVTFISVGTPSQANGSIDMRFVTTVCGEIGAALREKDGYHLIVARSTMLPGTTRGTVIPLLEQASGKKAGNDFGVCFNPEFLREGTSVYDFYNPPKTVIGATDEHAASVLREIYGSLPGKIFVTSLEVSEMVKYADNSFHAVKITFANEIGAVCKSLDIDSHAVMNIFCEDTKLNISVTYLKPGFAFGGSCLPKDVNALLYKARAMDLETPFLRSLLKSNAHQIAVTVQEILNMGKPRVGFLGYSFKAGTDDLRSSPIVEVIEALIGKGITIKLYDPSVHVAMLMGSNQNFIAHRIPHFVALMCKTADEVVRESDVIVVGNASKEFAEALKAVTPDKTIVDLVRIEKEKRTGGNYVGLYW